MTSCCQKAVDMLLDNEDKISVSTPEFFESSLSSWFKQMILSDGFLFWLQQIDKVVEELADRPELLHVVSYIWAP